MSVLKCCKVFSGGMKYFLTWANTRPKAERDGNPGERSVGSWHKGEQSCAGHPRTGGWEGKGLQGGYGEGAGWAEEQEGKRQSE